MLTGEIKMSEFIDQINQNPVAMELVATIIPQDAVNNPDH